MLASKRLQYITQIIQLEGTVDVKHLSEHLKVSEKTIRLDLNRLEQLNILKRVHGGATLMNKPDLTTIPSRTSLHANEKNDIAMKAKELIQKNDIIFLDDGSTILALAKVIKDMNITVLTHDFLIANELLGRENINLFVIGGKIRKATDTYITTGADAVDFIRRYHVNKLFLGTSTIDIDEGLMIFYHGDSSIKKALIASSDKVICLADSSKFGITAFTKFATVNDLDVLITDQKISKEQKEAFEKTNVEMIVV